MMMVIRYPLPLRQFDDILFERGIAKDVLNEAAALSNEVADALVRGGETIIVTPSFLVHVQRT